MTDSERKQVKKDLEILKKSSTSRYEESDNLDDPSAMNAKAAAEMGIEYPPDFEENEIQKPVKFKNCMKYLF